MKQTIVSLSFMASPLFKADAANISLQSGLGGEIKEIVRRPNHKSQRAKSE
jgi:hypothetical protein